MTEEGEASTTPAAGSARAAPPRLTVDLPGLLAPLVGQKRLSAEGSTLGEALDDLVRAHPQLRVHLFDESGAFREHVHCFWNGRNTRWLDGLDQPVEEGDTITLLQAVSGG